MLRLLTCGCSLIALLIAWSIPVPQDSITFLDVGQGDAILLQSGARQVLIDGGQGTAVLAPLAKQMSWFDRRLEVVVVTHPQRDHLEGLLHVLEQYEVGLVLLPLAVNSSQLQAEWLQMIIDKNIPYRFAWAGQHISLPGLHLQVVGPLDLPTSAAAIKSDVNNASVVIRAIFVPDDTVNGETDHRDLSILLTGDMEKRAENILVNNIPTADLDSDILKVGHHGSDTSTYASLLSAVSPRAAVISVGKDNKFGHPKDGTLDRLSPLPIFRTDQDGTIQIFQGKNRWWLRKIGK